MPEGSNGAGNDAAVDTGEFEALLKERRDALRHDIERELRKHDGQQFEDIIQQWADPDDRAVADLLVDLNLSEISRDSDELRAVQYALGRIESGSYGICQSCGRQIAPERLRAIPQTPLCIDCQARSERHTATPSL